MLKINRKLIPIQYDTYSTTETRTNKIWMDKPVYRKVIDFDVSPNSLNEHAFNIPNYDNIWINSGQSFIKTPTRSYVIARADYRDMNYQIGCFLATDSNKIFTLIGPGVFIGTGHAYIVFEYTKTTD